MTHLCGQVSRILRTVSSSPADARLKPKTRFTFVAPVALAT
jgi:hypothetical protein